MPLLFSILIFNFVLIIIYIFAKSKLVTNHLSIFRHPVLENILCFFAGFVVVITMGTGSKLYNPQKECLMLSLLQSLWGFSGDNKGARRHSPSLLLPHLLPQVFSKLWVFEVSEVVTHPLVNAWKLLIQLYYQGPEQWERCGRQVEDARPHLLPYHQLSRTQKPLLNSSLSTKPARHWAPTSTSLTSDQTFSNTLLSLSSLTVNICHQCMWYYWLHTMYYVGVSTENENQ